VWGFVVLFAAAAATRFGPGALGVAAIAVAIAALARFPPILLALAVYVPFFEEAPLINRATVDPTVAVNAVLLGVVVARVASKRGRVPPAGFLVPLAIIALLVVLGLEWTTAAQYGEEKALKFVSLTLLAALAPFVLITSRKDLELFLAAIAVGAIGVAALTPFVEPTVAAGIATQGDTEGRYSFGGQIFPSRFLCTGALILVLWPAFGRASQRWTGPLVAVGVIVIALGFGARGPIVAFGLALLAVVIFLAVRGARYVAALLVTLLVVGATLSFVPLPGQAAERITEAVTTPVQTLQQGVRSALYAESLRLIAEEPIRGVGTGGFATTGSALSPARQTLVYPHNVFLELWSELGIVALLALVVSVVTGFTVLLRRFALVRSPRERGLLALVVGLFMLNLLAAQFSGDINDNRTLLLFLGLVWLCATRSLAGGPEEERA
jgi:O-antigen ligase